MRSLLLTFAFGSAILVTSACGRDIEKHDEPSQEQTRPPAALIAALTGEQDTDEADLQNPDAAVLVGEDDDSVKEAFLTATAPETTTPSTQKPMDPKLLHIIIVPGWGYQLGRLLHFDYQTYASWFVQAGAPAENVHVLSYSYMKDLKTIKAEIKAQLAQITQSLDKDAKIDILGHSMGGFVGMFAAVEGGFAPRVRKLISVSGIPFGWNNRLCQGGICGAAHKELIPFQAPFVKGFHKAFAKDIVGFEKCSLYSPADLFVKPYNAGAFPDGHNVNVRGMGHLQAIGKKKFFNLMFQECYGGKFQ